MHSSYSALFKKTPPATKSKITFFNEKLSVPQCAQTRKSSRFIDKEDEGKAFLYCQYAPLRKYLGEKVNFLGGKFTSEKLT